MLGLFVALARRAFLPQRDAQRGGVGTDQVRGRIRSILRTPHRLAVERYKALRHPYKARNPFPKAALEHGGVQNKGNLVKYPD